MSEKKEKKEKEQKNAAEAEPSRRSRKKQNTHKAILHQAKVLFEKEGIGNVTIEQISESADVSRSTFFSHFASVDDLLKEISDEEINDVFEAAKKGDGELTVSALLKQLNDDTYPYPYLSAEVLMRGILSKGESNFAHPFGFQILSGICIQTLITFRRVSSSPPEPSAGILMQWTEDDRNI